MRVLAGMAELEQGRQRGRVNLPTLVLTRNYLWCSGVVFEFLLLWLRSARTSEIAIAPQRCIDRARVSHSTAVKLLHYTYASLRVHVQPVRLSKARTSSRPHPRTQHTKHETKH